MTIALILVEIFTVIMQRNVCEKAFDRKPAGTAVHIPQKQSTRSA